MCILYHYNQFSSSQVLSFTHNIFSCINIFFLPGTVQHGSRWTTSGSTSGRPLVIQNLVAWEPSRGQPLTGQHLDSRLEPSKKRARSIQWMVLNWTDQVKRWAALAGENKTYRD
jgi:hypothetical protein